MDVARYTIRAMGDPRTLNKTVHITPPANILSQNDLISIWEQKSGAVLKKEFVATSAVADTLKGELDLACPGQSGSQFSVEWPFTCIL